MKPLFILRIAALMFRPVVVFVEGEILPGENILPISLPIVMIGMLFASTPVYRSFYRLSVAASQDERNASQATYYASTLFNLLLGLFCVSCFAWLYIDGNKIPALGSALFLVGILFLIEKITDELARLFEFRKQFYLWTFLQFAKSSWLLIPIFVAYKFGSYLSMVFLFSSLFLAVLVLVVSHRSKRVINRISFSLCLPAIRSIFSLSHFVLPPLTVPVVRQVSRLVVSKLYPETSHIYLAIAQIMQACAVYFNVRYQIPYRKILAIKPLLFLSAVRKVYEMAALIAIVLITILILINSTLGDPVNLGSLGLVLVTMALGVEAIAFNLFTNIVAFFQWVSVSARIRVWLYTALLVVSVLSCYFGAQMLTNTNVAMPLIPIFTSAVALTAFWVSYALLRTTNLKR